MQHHVTQFHRQSPSPRASSSHWTATNLLFVAKINPHSRVEMKAQPQQVWEGDAKDQAGCRSTTTTGAGENYEKVLRKDV